MIPETYLLPLINFSGAFNLKFASILEKISIMRPAPERLDDACKYPVNNISILLADDDADDRELFSDIIRDIAPSITVLTVADGDALMTHLHSSGSNLPDLLFLDLNMPGRDGKQCLREIRSDLILKKVPVIIYSTSSRAQDITDTYSMGASLYYRKPNSYSGAMATIRKILSMDFENQHAKPDIGSYTLLHDKF